MEKIERINDRVILVDGVKYRMAGNKSPEFTFKVGDWIIAREYNHFPREPSRITKLQGMVFWCDSMSGKGKEYDVWRGSVLLIRYAFPLEVEFHLRMICNERYVGKRVKCLNGEIHFIIKISGYVTESDCLWYGDDNGMSVVVYKQGNFAEVIPDKENSVVAADFDPIKNSFFDNLGNQLTNENIQIGAKRKSYMKLITLYNEIAIAEKTANITFSIDTKKLTGDPIEPYLKPGDSIIIPASFLKKDDAQAIKPEIYRVKSYDTGMNETRVYMAAPRWGDVEIAVPIPSGTELLVTPIGYRP